MKVAKDTDILKAVSFDNVSVKYRYELFQQTNGLLYRCAQVGNEAARYLLSKVMIFVHGLISCSVLIAIAIVFSNGVPNYIRFSISPHI